MNRQTSTSILVIAIGCIILAGAVVVLVVRDCCSDEMAGWLSSREPTCVHAETNHGIESPQTNTPPPVALDCEEVERLVSTIPDVTRVQIVADPAAFAEVVRREAARRAVLRAALDPGLASNEQIAYLSKRAAEQVFVNTCVQIHTDANIPDEFPDEDQIESFYDQNLSRFTVGDGVLRWQVPGRRCRQRGSGGA